ncbi:unnamed protein product [Psylliodes chrysocephalus]|uniref:Uncharacterized protein n=1 Tax=Psylliodes chrysocephalus TaxID=3402493 RepID=A0A9P0CSQ1_9CUCU|nr:unnamed protein product [Psylliodes chrysocephala]
MPNFRIWFIAPIVFKTSSYVICLMVLITKCNHIENSTRIFIATCYKLQDMVKRISATRKLPEHFVQSNENKDKNNEFEKTSKINISQNIIIQNNDDGPHYKGDEVDTNILQHKEDYTVSEKSSDTNKLEEEQEEKTVEIRETNGKKRRRNSVN